jgi:glycosyltransferase involved in cell wall biosynthesis
LSASSRRVLVLNWLDRENPAAGGAEVHLHETFGRLARRGWTVTLVSSGWPGAAPQVELDGISVHRVGSRNTYPVHAIPFAREILRQDPPALVVEDLNKVPLFTPTWSQVPVLLLVHHLFGRTVFQEAPLHLALPTWLLERPIGAIYRATPTVAVSASTREDLVDRGIPSHEIRVIPNGIQLSDFDPATLGDRFSRPTILYLGRLKRYKRVDLVMKALARLKAQGIEAQLLIAGKGDHRSALEAQARKLKLGSEDVRFLGFVSEEEKRELLARSWVHCLTSPKEGWGIANLEAAASGTATVASDSPGLRDSVVDGETGYLVPHADLDALAGRIGQILTDPELRDELGRRGLTFAQGFSWERTAAELEAVLLQTVASAGSRM